MLAVHYKDRKKSTSEVRCLDSNYLNCRQFLQVTPEARSAFLLIKSVSCNSNIGARVWQQVVN